MDPKTRVLPVGRTEVPVEGGKYTVVIDHRPGKEGLAILRYDKRWLDGNEIYGSKMLIAMACELERCRDLLHKMRSSTHACYAWEKEIDEVLPPGYRPVTYTEDK